MLSEEAPEAKKPQKSHSQRSSQGLRTHFHRCHRPLEADESQGSLVYRLQHHREDEDFLQQEQEQEQEQGREGGLEEGGNPALEAVVLAELLEVEAVEAVEAVMLVEVPAVEVLEVGVLEVQEVAGSGWRMLDC